MPSDPQALIDALLDRGLEFVIVGGVAMIAARFNPLHPGSRNLLLANPENLERPEAALAPFRPELRDAPPGLPFRLDAARLPLALNFTLRAAAGDLKLLREVPGLAAFDAMIADTAAM